MKLMSISSHFAGFKRLAMAVVLCAAAVAQAALKSPETTPPTDYREGYTASVVPKAGNSITLYENAKLSKVIGVKGDFFFLHSNYSLPYLAECEWSNVDGVETSDGLFHYHYEKDGDTEYALCQFQGKFRGSYLFVTTLKLFQDGPAIKAQVVGTSYPWSSPYGSNQETLTFQNTYFEDLSAIVGSSGGMTRFCLSNVSLMFAEGGASIKATFSDLDGNVISEQMVEYGEAATPPDEALVPAIAGYVFAGWDGDYSVIQKDVVFKPVYHKLCEVRFVDGDGQLIGSVQTVEERKAATPPDMTGASHNGAPFYAWDGDTDLILDDTTFTAIYRNVPVWTTGSYELTNWTSAAKNVLPAATLANNAISYYSEGTRTDNKPENLTDRAVPPVKTTYEKIVGVKGGNIEWTLDQPYYIDSVSFFTSWGDGGRDGIAVDQILYKCDGGTEWIEAAGPIDANSVSFGVGDSTTSGNLFATLANTNGVAFMEKATALKVVFSSQQDNSGAGYVEIEATGKNQAELDGGAVVTFLDWNGTVLQTNFVAYGAAATPPADPVREGYKFIGWDADFSFIDRALTVTAQYHKWCSVTFKDADGTQIGEVQRVEETLAAEPPNMTGRTFHGATFLNWDGDPSVINDDIVFTAVYGSIPNEVLAFIAAHGDQLPADALVWAGGAQGEWNTTELCWVRPNGSVTSWTDGSKAVFPGAATITLNGERSVAEMLVFADVVLQGGDITLVAPAKIAYYAAATLRFVCNVKGEDGLVHTTCPETIFSSVFAPDTCLLEVDSESGADAASTSTNLWFRNVNLSEVSNIRGTMYAKQGSSTPTLTFDAVTKAKGSGDIAGQVLFFENDGETLTAQFQMQAYNYGKQYMYCIKVELKQIGNDVYGCVLYRKYSSSAHGLGVDNWDEIAPSNGQECHLYNVQLIQKLPTDIVTEIAGDCQVTGNLMVNAGKFSVVGSGKLGGGTMTTPVFIANDAVYEYASDFEQTFKGPINMKVGGSASTTSGRFVIATNAYVKINCSAEYTERVYAHTDVYGYAYVNDGNYHDFYSNSQGIYVHDGGTLSLGSGYGVYGHRNWIMIVEAGGTIIYRNKQNAGLAESGTQVLGGEIQFPTDYSANPQDNFFTKLVMQDGARLTGEIYTWAYGAYTHEIGGTTPSFIDVEKVRVGRTGDCNQWKNYTVGSGAKCVETLNVADVTGDAEADLVVSSELYANPYTIFTDATAQYFGIAKKGDGTVKFTGTSTNYNASLSLEAGSVAFGPEAKFNASAFILTGNGTFELETGAEVSFTDSSTQTWTADKTLDIQGELYRHTLRVGTDENGLTPEQLAQITYHGKPGRITIDGEGYLHGPGKGTKFVLQ